VCGCRLRWVTVLCHRQIHYNIHTHIHTIYTNTYILIHIYLIPTYLHTYTYAAYDKHYDNSGLADTRKVTVLYYMNQWRPECGGQFRIYAPSGAKIDIEPIADRLLVFWSDRLVHSVLPSEAPRGAEDHRYALTLWLTSTTTDAIVRDDAEVRKHFGDMI
jgi:Rps23 Pro-64 3,4-dihydroxylase Tpa1-like proline 4-hydroxylase